MSRRYKYSTNKKGTTKKAKLILFGFGLIAVGFVVFAEASNTSSYSGTSTSAPKKTVSTTPIRTLKEPLPWPQNGSAAYSAPNQNILVSSDKDAKAVPVASLIKVVTLVAVMREKPIEYGKQGPVITLTDKDVAIYHDFIRRDGAVTRVESGLQITQYQAMQAIMHASSNNMAESLVTWAFGSLDSYIHYANNMAREMGLNNTHIADASGLSPDSISTAQDIAVITDEYLRNPILREIAMQDGSTIPLVGNVKNWSTFINTENAFGVKSGNTDEAGKCFIIASVHTTPNAREKFSVAVVLGGNSTQEAANNALKILENGNGQLYN